jgi:hypothetical protein
LSEEGFKNLSGWFTQGIPRVKAERNLIGGREVTARNLIGGREATARNLIGGRRFQTLNETPEIEPVSIPCFQQVATCDTRATAISSS